LDAARSSQHAADAKCALLVTAHWRYVLSGSIPNYKTADNVTHHQECLNRDSRPWKLGSRLYGSLSAVGFRCRWLVAAKQRIMNMQDGMGMEAFIAL
jgi:hypothetical protein